MRAKKNKATKLSTTPQQLIQPPWNWKVRPNVINLGLTKSWLRRCNDNGGNDELRSWPPQLYQVDVDPSYNPLDFTHDDNLTYYFVVDVSTSRILPSKHSKIPSKFAPILSSHDQAISTPGVIDRMRLSGVASPCLFTHRLNQEKIHDNIYEFTFIKYECDTIDPFDAKKKCMQFTSIAKLKGGVVIALSLQGALAVMQEIGSRLTITAISSSRAVPSVSSRFFKEYLVQLNGEILLVFLIHQKTLRVVDKIEVFSLCFPDLKWIKVERLKGNYALFLDQRRMRVSSTGTGFRGNCIYFTHGSENGWWIYDMGNGCILPV